MVASVTIFLRISVTFWCIVAVVILVVRCCIVLCFLIPKDVCLQFMTLFTIRPYAGVGYYGILLLLVCLGVVQCNYYDSNNNLNL